MAHRAAVLGRRGARRAGPWRAPGVSVVAHRALFRLPLALPAIVLWSVLGVVLSLVAVAAWFVAVALGRTTAGLQELGTFCLRYQLETEAYLLLLTAAYPRLAPPGVTTEPG